MYKVVQPYNFVPIHLKTLDERDKNVKENINDQNWSKETTRKYSKRIEVMFKNTSPNLPLFITQGTSSL